MKGCAQGHRTGASASLSVRLPSGRPSGPTPHASTFVYPSRFCWLHPKMDSLVFSWRSSHFLRATSQKGALPRVLPPPPASPVSVPSPSTHPTWDYFTYLLIEVVIVHLTHWSKGGKFDCLSLSPVPTTTLCGIFISHLIHNFILY